MTFPLKPIAYERPDFMNYAQECAHNYNGRSDMLHKAGSEYVSGFLNPGRHCTQTDYAMVEQLLKDIMSPGDLAAFFKGLTTYKS